TGVGLETQVAAQVRKQVRRPGSAVLKLSLHLARLQVHDFTMPVATPLGARLHGEEGRFGGLAPQGAGVEVPDQDVLGLPGTGDLHREHGPACRIEHGPPVHLPGRGITPPRGEAAVESEAPYLQPRFQRVRYVLEGDGAEPRAV